MSYTYTVPKRKANRLAFRLLGSVFVLISVLQFFTLLYGYSKHPMITMVFMLALCVYGLYLIWGSLRKAAFDITYRFDEEGLTVTHRYGVTKYGFEDIKFITMVLADEVGIFYILNVRTKKDVYVIPFTMKGKLCETIYEFVNARIAHEEDDTPELVIPEKYLPKKNEGEMDAQVEKSESKDNDE